MAAFDITNFLKQQGLRDTQSRRAVIDAMQQMDVPASPYEIQKWIAKEGGSVNTVTIYRVMALLEEHALAHKHPGSGLYSLCTLPGTPGHHGYLHCSSCGKSEEFRDEKLCSIENSIARSAGFLPQGHICEITGLCPTCA